MTVGGGGGGDLSSNTGLEETKSTYVPQNYRSQKKKEVPLIC